MVDKSIIKSSHSFNCCLQFLLWISTTSNHLLEVSKRQFTLYLLPNQFGCSHVYQTQSQLSLVQIRFFQTSHDLYLDLSFCGNFWDHITNSSCATKWCNNLIIVSDALQWYQTSVDTRRFTKYIFEVITFQKDNVLQTKSDKVFTRESVRKQKYHTNYTHFGTTIVVKASKITYS